MFIYHGTHQLIRMGMGFLLISILFMGCQRSTDTLDALEKSLHKITGEAEISVVVVELMYTECCDSDPDSVRCKHRFGSGFVYSAEGLVVTTEGLVAPADSLWVITQTGRRLPATLVGKDFETNIAILHVADLNLKYLNLHTSGHPNGCLAVMVGNTYYSEGLTCSLGITNGSWIGGGDFLDDKLFTMQVNWPDAQSGTPVLDTRGNLIGIAEGHLGKSHTTWTIIPAKTIQTVAEHILKNGGIERGWIGIRSNPVCPRAKTARLMKMWKGQGAVVSSLVDNSPADQAGLQIGDVVVKLNNEGIECISDFRRRVTAMAPGDQIHLLINRDGEEFETDIVLKRLPEDPQRQRRSIRRSA